MSAHALKGYIQCPHNSYLRYAPNDCFIIYNSLISPMLVEARFEGNRHSYA